MFLPVRSTFFIPAAACALAPWIVGGVACERASGDAGAAGEREIVLEELLNHAWHDEPLSYGFEAPEDAAHIDSLRLEGPNGAMPVQLSDVELWPGTRTVRAATLWLVTDLAPLTENVYTVRYAPEPGNDADPARSDLSVEATDERVTLTNDGFGVRLRLGGQRYDQPRDAADVPAPVEALRLANGTWFGGSALYGPTNVRAWSAELTEAGPVFGEVRYRYEYDNGNELVFTARLFARADRAQFDVDVAQDNRQDGLRIELSDNLPTLTMHVQKLWHDRRENSPDDLPIGEWWSAPVTDLQAGEIHRVTPWAPWWNDRQAPVVRLGMDDGERELHVARRDPTAWVEPGGQTRRKQLPIRKSSDGTIYIDVDLAAGEAGGVRKFDVADAAATEAVGWRHRRDERYDPPRRTGSQVIPYREPLNAVKDYVLDWPQESEHPRIFMTAGQVAQSRPDEVDEKRMTQLRRRAGDGPTGHPHGSDTDALVLWLLTGDDALAEEIGLADRLIHHLGLLGDFDKMRKTIDVAALYDAVIESDQINSEQRRVLRAQMAYLGYQVAHPATWSYERGWASGNQNMTVSYAMMSPGVMAAALPNHPHAERCLEPANEMMEFLLDQIGPVGEWPESTGYSNLSVSELLIYAIMTSNAGLTDYIDDPRLRQAVTHLIKIRQPSDPRTGGIRDHIRYGRSPGRTRALDATLARTIVESDPELARHMQWTWLDTLEPGAQTSDITLGGFEHLYLDPDLPAEPPDWDTELFPEMGVIFRQGFATDREHFAALLGGDQMAMIYASQAGAIASLFAYGQPVAGSFLGGYGNQAEFLVNRVSLARDPGDFVLGDSPFHYRGAPRQGWWFDPERPQAKFEEQEGDVNVSAFSALPRQDYASVDVLMKLPWAPGGDKMRPPKDLPWPELLAGEGVPPLWWRRQALYMKNDEPGGANYMLLRDTVSGDQPTMWTFWTASEKIGTYEEVVDREAFLANGPGQRIVEPRELGGDRFTALGAWGVDLEFYVAEPTDTPRHTLRWGTKWEVSRRWGVSQYQDLLHLQREDDGVYYVALYPRKPEHEVPQFTTLGDDKIIKVEHPHGTDWGFLSGHPDAAEAEGIRFTGTAGSVQQHGDETLLNLGAAGSVRTAAVTLEAQHAAAVHWLGAPGEVRGDAVRVELPREHAGVEVRLELPEGAYAATDDAVTLEQRNDGWRVTVPEGVSAFELARQ